MVPREPGVPEVTPQKGPGLWRTYANGHGSMRIRVAVHLSDKSALWPEMPDACGSANEWDSNLVAEEGLEPPTRGL